MSNNLICTIYEATRKFLRKIITYSITPLFWIFIFFLHVGIFAYASKHIYLFESPEVYDALTKQQHTNEFKAIGYIFGLIIFWLYMFWLGIKSSFSNNRSRSSLFRRSSYCGSNCFSTIIL